MNRFVWDLKYPDAAWFRGMVLWTGFLRGPVAVPGTYTVKLTVANATESQTFTVKNDPRSTARQADLEEQFNLAMKVRDKTSAANDMVIQIRVLKNQHHYVLDGGTSHLQLVARRPAVGSQFR